MKLYGKSNKTLIRGLFTCNKLMKDIAVIKAKLDVIEEIKIDAKTIGTRVDHQHRSRKINLLLILIPRKETKQ